MLEEPQEARLEWSEEARDEGRDVRRWQVMEGPMGIRVLDFTEGGEEPMQGFEQRSVMISLTPWKPLGLSWQK